MRDEQLAVVEPQMLQAFKDDSKKLGGFISDFITTFYPSYGVANEFMVALPQENSLDLLNSFNFYKIFECSIYNVDDKFVFFAEKMKKLFITAYSIKQEVCYGVVSNQGRTSLVLGVAPTSNDETIKVIIEGLLPGVKIEKYADRFVNEKNGTSNNAKDKDRYVGCICGVPALKVDGQFQNKDLSSLMRSLNGQDYTIMVLCKPVDEDSIQEKIKKAIKIQDECFAISKRTMSLQKNESNGNTHTDTFNETNGTSSSTTKGSNLILQLKDYFCGATTETSGETSNISTGYSDAVINTISNSGSISEDVQNGFAIELMKMAESMVERLKIGRSIGMWESVITYSSSRKIVSDIIQGSLYSDIASGIPEVLPPVVFSYTDSCAGVNLPTDKIHCQQLMIPKGFFGGNCQSSLCSFVTSEEICGICTIPIDNTVGFEIKESKNYALNYKWQLKDKLLGYVCEYDRPLTNIPFGLCEYDLNKHTFVCGITGSGKTNTVKKILEAINQPFLVIEPVKKEYRNIKKKVEVYTLGRPEINCLKFNPFYILPGISPQQHIDLLKDLFSASFAFYGPMPYILEKCLYNVYTKKGWELTLGFHPCLVNGKSQQVLFDANRLKELYAIKSHKYLFPTMQDLKDEVDYYIENEMTYDGEVKGNIRGAIKARIDSLCVGSKGYMFNTHDMVDIGNLLGQNSVLELEGLADDADKAFALGLLIIYVNEYRQLEKEIGETKGLRHLLVIEEAHRLLKNVSTENNQDLGNPKGKAVEHFANMLAEMRSYGQGVIVAEQIPSKLAPDVIKNSSNKIIHRIIGKDDQEIVANTIGVYQEDAIYLGNSNVGYAMCHKEGMVQPVIVKIDEVDTNHILDINLYNKDIDAKMFRINQSIIENQLSNEISAWAVKTLVSLLYMPRADEIYDGLEYAYEQISRCVSIKAITVIPGVDKKECVMKCISDSVISFLISGVFSNRKLPNDDFIKLIQQTVRTPTEDRLKQVQKSFEVFYAKRPSKKAVETIASLLSEDYAEKMDISNAIKDFTLVKNSKLCEDVLDYLNEVMS